MSLFVDELEKHTSKGQRAVLVAFLNHQFTLLVAGDATDEEIRGQAWQHIRDHLVRIVHDNKEDIR